MSSQYEVSLFEGTYQFITKNGIQYVCTFKDVTENFDDFDIKHCRIHMFNLTNISIGALPPLDSRVGVTVTWILSEFFKGNDDVVIYVADTKDGRHEKRRQRFDRWLRDYPIAGVVIDNYTYQNLLAGIIRKETELHKLISDELRMRFDKMKEGY
ncbi:DUF6169 family protein [Dawidia soli]|uniref:Uncharacterized protein n=1 Tax=Dawidia soli TaxID=2782352 RepID=A0AAP2D5D0_9BACT|nr:DUF6169 family protein [Dawidia soli]MBT1685666.1 hypothetical protein [Dawidia soli]